ncbi:MAG TPA: hypothetical protein VHM89_03335 [Acidimicrobiales bacterium]|nr:hypothetical protein [Acidimicrobiales bacterium]
MASHLAASAFGHCLALVRDDDEATRLAVVAVRKGGRSLGAVLGHARHQALAAVAAGPPPPPVLGPDAGPCEVAWALAASRSALELALVDLGRYRLGRAGLGLALRMTPSAAAERVAAVARRWDAELDPALLAWLGPGDCDVLAGVLAGHPTGTAADLLASAGEVTAHTAQCVACADRQRAMASVRLVLAGTALPEPPLEVTVAASGSRLQPPVPPPPLSLGPRGRMTTALGLAAVAMAVVGFAALVTSSGDSGDSRRDALLALTKLPVSSGSLGLVPTEVDPSARQLEIVNTSRAVVRWEAAADAPWLEVVPAAGRLQPGAKEVMALRGFPPEGEVRASVRVTGDDGSAAMAAVTGTVEHPPDLGAAADGCTVTADVEDESDVVLTLHWRVGGADTATPMSPPVDAKSTGSLPAAVAPLTWWVSAVDGRGNQARTPDALVTTAC